MTYSLTPARKKTVTAFAREYPFWVRDYNLITHTKKSQRMGDMRTKTNEIGRPTEKLAIRRVSLLKKMVMIEQTAASVDPVIQKYLLRGVTEGRPFEKLLADGLCMSRNTYYDRRRKFYYVLSEKMERMGI